MKLNKLTKSTQTAKKRVGRGYGSGKGGHTSGRGQKGQKSRGKVPLYFEGTAMRKSLIRRLPMMRGKSKNIVHKKKPVIINLKYLNFLKPKSVVGVDVLIKKGLIDAQEAKECGVKILGDGELKVALTVQLPISKSAAEKVVKAGGKVIPFVKAKKTVAKAAEKKKKKAVIKTPKKVVNKTTKKTKKTTKKTTKKISKK